MEPADTYTHAGCTIEIHYDEDCEYANPRSDNDFNLGYMICEHRNYILGDEQGVPETELSLVDYIKKEHGARVVLPLFLYDHSGISMSAGGRLDTGEDNLRSTNRFVGDAAGWDTSTVGVIFDTADSRKTCEWEDKTDEEIEKALRAEVKLYDDYITGQVYGYSIERLADTDEGEGEPLPDRLHESCWGFLGDYDESGLREQANAQAEYIERALVTESNERAHWAARDVITIGE